MADSMTSGEVERAFGHVVTRSAIIGKAKRLGLVWANNAGGVSRKTGIGVLGFKRRHQRSPTVTTQPLPIEEPINGLEFEPGVFVGILAVNDRMCRWPIGDPLEIHDTNKFHYCGRQPLTGSPYCEAHERKAHQPSKRHRQLAA